MDIKVVAMNIPIIIAVSMGIVGLIFFIVAVVLSVSFKAAERDSTITYGTLVCFRKYDYIVGVDDGYHAYKDNPPEDYSENIVSSRPVVKFLHNGDEVTRSAEYPNSKLSSDDIGKQFKIRYTKNFKVYFDDNDSRKDSVRIQNKLFSILIGIAIALFVLALAIYTRFYRMSN